jgi:hypothetical protein
MKVNFPLKKKQLERVFCIEKSGMNKNLRQFHPTKIKGNQQNQKLHKCWKKGFLRGSNSDQENVSKKGFLFEQLYFSFEGLCPEDEYQAKWSFINFINIFSPGADEINLKQLGLFLKDSMDKPWKTQLKF